MHGLQREQITELRANPFIEDIIDENGRVKTSDRSMILRGHFGIVPGVINEEMARILAGFSSGATLETDFNNTLKPGNCIGFRGGKEEPEIYIAGEKSTPILNTANVSGRDLVHYNFPEAYHCTDLDDSFLSYHLLQSSDFKLVSGATTMDHDGYFSGHYSIPENYPFLTENSLPFGFMKEVANQVISLSNSLTNNPEGVQSGSTILLANSHIAREYPDYPITAPGGSRIIVTGKAGIDPADPKKRRLIAEYTAYNENIPLYHGKITGTRVLTKMLFR